MKLIYYVLLAAIFAEASFVLHAVAADEAKASEQQQNNQPTASSASSSVKKPKIRRTVRVKESGPEVSTAPSAPAIHNEGATNHVDLKPNINVHLPGQQQQQQPATPDDEESSADSSPEVSTDVEQPKEANNNNNNKGNTEILSTGDIGNTKVTKIGNVGNKEITEINDVNNQRGPAEPHPHPHPPCPHHQPHPHPIAHHHHQPEGVKIESSVGGPLFQININGQENKLSKEPSVIQPTIKPAEVVVPVVSSTGEILMPQQVNLNRDEGSKVFTPVLKDEKQQNSVVLPTVSLPNQSGYVMLRPQLQAIPGETMPATMMMPQFSPYQLPMMPMQIPIPVQMPMMPMMPPMWNPYMPPMGPPFWDRPHKRHHHKKDKKEKKPKKERKEKDDKPELTTPAPVVSTTTEPSVQFHPHLIAQKMLPEVPTTTTTTTTTTPKPAEEIEWETVRVPKIRRKS